MEQDISRLIGKLAEVPNIQKTTAVLVDEHQIKKQTGTSGSSFRWIYLDQLLGKTVFYLGWSQGNVVYSAFQVNLRRSLQSVAMSTQNAITIDRKNFMRCISLLGHLYL